MKKLAITLLIMILSLPVMVNAVVWGSASPDNVNVYIFTSDSCKSCDKTVQYVEKLKEENIRVVVHTMDSTDNQELLDQVKDSLKIKSKKLPLVIIGTNFFTGNEKELEKGIQAYLGKDEHCDLIATIQDKGDIQACIQKNDGIYEQPKGFPVFAIVAAIVVVIAIAAIVVIVVKKKSKTA